MLSKRTKRNRDFGRRMTHAGSCRGCILGMAAGFIRSLGTAPCKMHVSISQFAKERFALLQTFGPILFFPVVTPLFYFKYFFRRINGDMAWTLLLPFLIPNHSKLSICAERTEASLSEKLDVCCHPFGYIFFGSMCI